MRFIVAIRPNRKLKNRIIRLETLNSLLSSELGDLKTTFDGVIEPCEAKLSDLYADPELAAKTHNQLIAMVQTQAGLLERKEAANSEIRTQVANVTEQLKSRADTYKTLAGFMMTAGALFVGFQLIRAKEVSDAVEKVAIANHQVTSMREGIVRDYDQMLGYQSILVQAEYDLLLAVRSEALRVPGLAMKRSDKLITQLLAMRSFLVSSPAINDGDESLKLPANKKMTENLNAVINRVLIQSYSVSIRNTYKVWKDSNGGSDDPLLSELKEKCNRMIAIINESKSDLPPDPYRFMALVAQQEALQARNDKKPEVQYQRLKDAAEAFKRAAKLDVEQRIDVGNAAESLFLANNFREAREFAEDYLKDQRLSSSQRITSEFIVAASREAGGEVGALDQFVSHLDKTSKELREFNTLGNQTFGDLISKVGEDGKTALPDRIVGKYKLALKKIVDLGGYTIDIAKVKNW